MGAPDDTETGQADAGETPDAADPLRRRIAVSLGVLVVLGAALAILQVDATVRESNSARETTRTAVQAMSANVVSGTVASLGSDLQAETDFLPFRRPLDSGIPSLASAAGLPASASRAASDLAAAQRAVPTLGATTMLTALQIEGQRLTLKQQALATTRITWNDRSTQYTTVIAVLAAALFLVGFGLIVEGPIRGSAYALGIGVGIFAAVWAVWIYQLPIPTTPDAAIAATARGSVLAAHGDYRPALAAYDRALHADSRYAAAYTGRSRARLLEANPDYPLSRAFTETRGKVVAAAVSDARRALELNGHRDLLTVGLVGLTSFYAGDYTHAIDAADEAAGINPNVPDVWLLKSAAQLALGDHTGASASLERALAPLRGTAPSQRTRLLASTYLSYLAWIARHVPTEAPAARRLSDQIVSRETAFTLGQKLSGSAPRSGRVAVEGLRYADGKLLLRLSWSKLPKGTALSGIAYERPLVGGAWTQPADLALFATVAGSGERDISVAVKRVCKPTEVRVDVFLNGARVLSRTGPGVSATC